MGFLGKIFGGGTSLATMRRACEQGRFADAVHQGEDLLIKGEDSDELKSLLVTAGDGLARLNLAEGECCLQAGDRVRGAEHLRLALAQAGSAELIAELEALLAGQEAEVLLRTTVSVKNAPEASAGCSSCVSTSATNEGGSPEEDVSDPSFRLELILAAYPPELQQRYLARSHVFLQAFLLVHSGEDQGSLRYWEQVPENERDDLYLFELGCLYGRIGDTARAVESLQQALLSAPGNLLIIEALLQLFLANKDQTAATDLLVRQLERGADPGFCHARLCEMTYQAGALEEALAEARKGVSAGFAEAGFLVLAARLFEQAGQVRDAERLLSGLSGGGCSGGVNLHLAELWLRQKQELGKVLDAFNAACRSEPDNPRWQLRVAQTYLARNWRKQGVELLRRVAGDPRLDDRLRLEAEQLLADV